MGDERSDSVGVQTPAEKPAPPADASIFQREFFERTREYRAQYAKVHLILSMFAEK